MAELIPHSSSSTPQSSHQTQLVSPFSTTRSMPAREDCWSEDATFTLIEAWGTRYIDLNRGNLRQKQWQEVANTVNAAHGQVKKARRTDVQCKNRIDTLKKKYKIEKARVLDSDGSYKSPWLFFAPLDHLIGSIMPIKKVSGSQSQSISLSPPLGVPIHHHGGGNVNYNVANMSNMMNVSSNVSTPILPQKRQADFRRNYEAVAAAAAAAAREEEESEEERERGEGEEREGDGIRKLAKVIEKFGEVYARVEREKQKQMIELEKQRMQFAKEMECQRMQLLVEMQLQTEKIKRSSHSDGETCYLLRTLISH